ncbi:hypothetical protein JTB14_010775 [Gonioctena quinquepunctata]|nr:hypothetical protein JTB14_010775 [Gonioctena quinquepunctata]
MKISLRVKPPPTTRNVSINSFASCTSTPIRFIELQAGYSPFSAHRAHRHNIFKSDPATQSEYQNVIRLLDDSVKGEGDDTGIVIE